MPTSAIAQSASILNSIFIALVVVENGHIAWGNAACHRLLECAPDELTGKPIHSVFSDPDPDGELGRKVRSALAGTGRYCGMDLHTRKDGSRSWLEFDIVRLDDHPDMLIVTIVDRTSSHILAEQLQASEARYRSVVEDQTEVICRLLPDGRFVFVNEVYCRFFGKSAAELIGMRWHPVAHPDDLPMIEAKLREMSATNPVVTIENRVFTGSGELRWMQFVNRGFYDTEGHLMEIQSVGRDVSDRKQAELTLKDKTEMLELALSGSGMACWDWDIGHHKVTGDKHWSAMLGYLPGELGQEEDQWMGLIDPRDRGHFERTLNTYLQGDSSKYRSEHRLRHKDGHWVTVEARGRITHTDEQGVPRRMVGTVLDITQRKRLNDEGIEMLKRIEALIRESASNSVVPDESGSALDSLTRRERQILGMIAEGMTSAQIGKRLQLATNTIITHRKNLMGKLDLHTTVEVTRFAMDHGLLKPKR